MLGCGRMGRFSGVTAVNLRGASGAGVRLQAQPLESPLGSMFLGDKKATVSGGDDRDADADGRFYNEAFIWQMCIGSLCCAIGPGLRDTAMDETDLAFRELPLG